MTQITESSAAKEHAAAEIARVAAERAAKKFASPRHGKIGRALQMDMNFFMIYYVFPAILMTGHEDAVLIADRLRDEWGSRFKDSKIQYTDYDTLYGAFREKIFGIF